MTKDGHKRSTCRKAENPKEGRKGRLRWDEKEREVKRKTALDRGTVNLRKWKGERRLEPQVPISFKRKI